MNHHQSNTSSQKFWLIFTNFEAFKPWLVAFTLPVLVLMMGSTVFAPMVKTAILNVSHPILVYGILFAFVLGSVLSASALIWFQKERWLVHHWVQLPSNDERRAWIEGNTQYAKHTVYPALCAVVLRMSPAERQAKFEHEMRAVESGLSDRLVFPNFIAASLVGLGLVGTFVGLLGTLEDLGAVFGSLSQTGDTSANPTAVFADMVQKLQDPMRGMGTAFVTSLFGLLGSLILGLTSLSIAKLANLIVKDLYSAERIFASMSVDPLPTVRSHAGTALPAGGLTVDAVLSKMLESQSNTEAQLVSWLQSTEERLINLVDTMLQTNRVAFREAVDNQQKTAQAILVALEDHNQSAQQFALQTREQQNQLTETVRLLANQVNGDRTMIYRELLTLIDLNRNEAKQQIQELSEKLSGTLHVTEISARNIERFIQVQQEAVDGLPKTGYWRDAWIKVQNFLADSSRQQDLSCLSKVVEKQTLVLHQLADQLVHQDWIRSQSESTQSTNKPSQ